MNCLIAHEVGHFVFGELQLLNSLSQPISDALVAAFASVLTQLTPEDRLRVPTVVAGWAEELFCDLFAVRLVGPCYTFAFAEIFDLTNNFNLNGTINPVAAAPAMEFSDSHPADLYRVQKQVSSLTRLKWWDEVKDSKSLYKDLLEHCKTLNPSQFLFPAQVQFQAYFIRAIDRVSTDVETAVESSLTGLETGVKEFALLRKTVQEYFHHGIVPSTIHHPSSAETVSPSAVTLLNAAYQLYLESLPALINRIEGQNAESVEHRSFWTQKLEAWTIKALEDLELIASAERS